MKHLICGLAVALTLPWVAGAAYAQACQAPARSTTQYDPNTPITLQQAIRRAGQAAPEILIAALEARAVSADADQAGRRQNPALSIETENFAGTGAFEGFDSYETTFAVEQTFQLGGKRQLSERAGRAQAALASAECAVQRLAVQQMAGEIFLELQAMIALAGVSADAADLAEEFATIVRRRVEAGAAAPPELARANADASARRALADAAQGQVEAKALALAALWGSADRDFALPAEFGTSQQDDDLSATTAPSIHPRITAAEAGTDARQAATDRARAGAWPDITISAGVRRFEDTGDNALIAGVSLPVPIFDRNQDATRAATLRSEGAVLHARAVEARLRAEQASLVALSRSARARLERLEQEALPFAEDAFDAATEGYRVGKFDLTATLDARRSLIETRAATIEARLSLETETLRLRALIGAAPFERETQ